MGRKAETDEDERSADACEEVIASVTNEGGAAWNDNAETEEEGNVDA